MYVDHATCATCASQFVSAAAPGSRWDVCMEYLPEDDSDDEEEGGDKERPAPAEGDAKAGPSQPAAA